jgi:hypothetical protein
VATSQDDDVRPFHVSVSVSDHDDVDEIVDDHVHVAGCG